MKNKRFWGWTLLSLWGGLNIGSLMDSYGQIKPSYTVDWTLIVSFIGISLVPLILGYWIGKDE